MVYNGLRTVVVAALITIGCLATGYAAPIAPGASAGLSAPPVKFATFWGRPFPYGYVYLPGQCYRHVQVETPTGYVWRRVWICTERRGRGYGYVRY
jgi:hypothetical protein